MLEQPTSPTKGWVSILDMNVMLASKPKYVLEYPHRIVEATCLKEFHHLWIYSAESPFLLHGTWPDTMASCRGPIVRSTTNSLGMVKRMDTW